MLLAPLLSFAVAAPADDVRAAFAHGQPDVALSCSPVGKLTTFLSEIPLPPALTQKLGDGPEGRLLSELLDPAKSRALGIDPEGGFTLVMRKDKTGELSVGFSGDRTAAEAFLRRTSPDLVAAGDGWDIPDSTPTHARLASGRLSFTFGMAGAAVEAPAALLDGYPSVPGCVLYGDAPKGNISVFLPLSGGAPAFVRFTSPEPMPAMGRPTVPPVGGTSAEVPALVGAVGIPLDPVLDLLAKVGKKVEQSQLDQIHGVVSFPAGATFATFGNPRAGDFVVVLPVADKNGRPLGKGKLRKFVKAAAGQMGTVSRGPGGMLQLDSGKRVWSAGVEKGMVVLGGSSARVKEALSGEGTPWITPAFQEWYQDWPVAVVGGGQFPVRFGLRGEAQTVEMAVELKGVDPKLVTGMIGMVAGMAGSQFDQFQLKAKRAEVPGNVDGILISELSYQAAFDTCLPVPPAPRPVEALGKDDVAWTATPEWTTLGWAAEGKVRGTYWVEKNADGCVVNGVIDADGDGVPARYRRVVGGELEQLTGDGVY